MRVGTGITALRFDDGHGLFGFGPNGGVGVNVPVGSEEHDRLQARALYIEEGDQKLLVVSFDLPSGSEIIHRALVEALAKRGARLAPGQICVVGTHTHSAPGHFFGNVYDVFGQRPALYREAVAAEIARRGLKAALRAMEAPVPCNAATSRRIVWGAGRNRSLRAFLNNFGGDVGQWRSALGVTPPAGLSPEEQSVDPRLSVVAFVAKADGRPLATWATWCCHPASVPPAVLRAYHRDWPGVAVDYLEQRTRAVPFAMIHQGANGDVTAIPSGDRRVVRPMDRIGHLGRTIGQAWLEAFAEAKDAATSADRGSPFELGFSVLAPEREGLPRFEIGQSVVAGSEEADPGILVKTLGEARRLPWRGSSPHRPKLPALGPLQAILRRHPALRVSPEHPLWLVRLGSHLFFASPFEQTTFSAWTTARAIAAAWKASRGEEVTASPIGLAGDYAGYVTTSREYEVQEYEGGHTIYGRDQRSVLERAWSRMIDRSPLDATRETLRERDAVFEGRVRDLVEVLPVT